MSTILGVYLGVELLMSYMLDTNKGSRRGVQVIRLIVDAESN